MRKEYPAARSLSIAQAQLLRAHDEIRMATSRLRLRVDDNDKSLDAIGLGELEQNNVQFSNDKFLSLDELERVKGKLRYLKVDESSYLLCLLLILNLFCILFPEIRVACDPRAWCK